MNRDDIWIVDALEGLLPPQTVHLVRTHIQQPQLILPSLWAQTSVLTAKLHSTLTPVLTPLANRALLALHDSPDLVVLAFALGFFVLLIQIVSFVHRTMLLAARLAFRAAAWALFVALLAIVWRRGPEATIRDVAVLVGKLAGYAALVRDIWWSEYQKFDAQTKRNSSGAGHQRVPSGYTRAGKGGW
ncbi:hypothetical protein AAE478_001616 [Parahypoxylon ruwenzoriense]